jgi:hypothetical protein
MSEGLSGILSLRKQESEQVRHEWNNKVNSHISHHIGPQTPPGDAADFEGLPGSHSRNVVIDTPNVCEILPERLSPSELFTPE